MRRTNPTGLIIAGTQPKCGKTVLTTGIAATLQDEGIKVRAIKPISFGTPQSCQSEYAFLTTIAHTPLNYPVQYAERPGALKASQFQAAINAAASGTDPVIVELPGGTATPLTLSDGRGNSWQDSTDFAGELVWPVILVDKASPDSFERLSLNARYLLDKGIELLGVACAMTEADCSLPEPVPHVLNWEIALAEKIGAPYLGCLKYSQSISVQNANQGNLIRTTSDAIDLLPIIKALSLSMAV